jgi:hypothetical protein
MTQPTFLGPDAIRAHPNFSKSRKTYIDAVLELYEGKPFLAELMLDGGRIIVYASIMALWGGHRADDVASLPTISRVKKTVGLFEVASPRQIDLILARFAQVGHIHVTQAPNDLRMRIALPTPALIEHDRAFIRAHYSALGELQGRELYALPLAGDLVFLKAMRGAWITTLEAMAKEVFTANPLILRFYAASAGILILMKLVQMQDSNAGRPFAIDYTDLGQLFGVSRTHVRTLLKAAAADGELELGANGHLQVGPDLLASFDRNFAGRMSLLDRAHTAAASLMKPGLATA